MAGHYFYAAFIRRVRKRRAQVAADEKEFSLFSFSSVGKCHSFGCWQFQVQPRELRLFERLENSASLLAPLFAVCRLPFAFCLLPFAFSNLTHNGFFFASFSRQFFLAKAAA